MKNAFYENIEKYRPGSPALVVEFFIRRPKQWPFGGPERMRYGDGFNHWLKTKGTCSPWKFNQMGCVLFFEMLCLRLFKQFR
jgi:hypothetical protein